MNVTICIGTYGTDEWRERGAEKKMILSKQFPDKPVVHYHGTGLSECRNGAVALADTEWVSIVDADDLLTDDFYDVVESEYLDGIDLISPRLRHRYVDDKPDVVDDLSDRNILFTNSCSIGTLFRKEMWEQAHGFKDIICFEDWEFFRNCVVNQDAKILFTTAEYVYVQNFGESVNPNRHKVFCGIMGGVYH